MKCRIKVGQDFDPEQQLKFDVEVIITEEQPEKKPGVWSVFTDWRCLAVIAVLVFVGSFGVHAAVTGDASLFDKVLDVIVKVGAERLKGESDGKESG